MSETPGGYRFPYSRTPGTSTAPAATTPKEGVADLWGFFWLSLLSSAIIGAAGVATWFWIHKP